MNADDADNTTSLATFRIDDVRKPGVVPGVAHQSPQVAA
jgi:hypothetical protein